jgi:hypothetical protein
VPNYGSISTKTILLKSSYLQIIAVRRQHLNWRKHYSTEDMLVGFDRSQFYDLVGSRIVEEQVQV